MATGTEIEIAPFNPYDADIYDIQCHLFNLLENRMTEKYTDPPSTLITNDLFESLWLKSIIDIHILMPAVQIWTLKSFVKIT